MFLRKTLLIILCLFMLPPALTGCQAIQTQPLSQTAFQFDTVITVTIYDSVESSVLEDCMEYASHYELLFSRTNPASELYQLNHGTLPKSGAGQLVSDETAQLISLALDYCELSDGAFDITMAPVIDLWDFHTDTPTIPTDEMIAEALSHVDYRKVHVNGNCVSFDEPGMMLDLGAIAKGYIADRLLDYLTERRVHNALINLGGNVLCMGEKPDASPYRIGIQKPFAPQGDSLTTLTLQDESLVSSGTYERYFEKDGKRYHHILSSTDGYPCDNGLSGVTILTPSSASADALSTTCFLLGKEKGLALIESLDDTEALFVSEDGSITYSSGFPH